eukprot:c1811_g1_i1.p1 GENE.c1811_g1_i1~~c1811_g1_i1.p1  ORF type:complete len:521 (-),score=137.32 c1811_g1_i1:20-1582(-)
MGKLDAKLVKFLSKEEFRVLISVELGMRNHDLVPVDLIASISNLKTGGAYKIIRLLLKNKLVSHASVPYDGYRLTYKGYDYLALRSLANRASIVGVGSQIGVGKESDVYLAVDENGRNLVLKIHRLGRVCFRAVKTKRDYFEHRQSVSNWMYLSRLAALKEYAYMKVLHEHNFPVPEPIDHNRHCVLMTHADGFAFSQIRELRHPGRVFQTLMEVMVRLANYGLVHCDFNEFNLIISEDEKATLIDFPQMVSITHTNAEEFFNRDVLCLRQHFQRKFGFDPVNYPTLSKDVKREHSLDRQVAASGWTGDHEKHLVELREQQIGELSGEGVIDVTEAEAAGDDLTAIADATAVTVNNENDQNDESESSETDESDDEESENETNDAPPDDSELPNILSQRANITTSGLNRNRVVDPLLEHEDDTVYVADEAAPVPVFTRTESDEEAEIANRHVWRGHRQATKAAQPKQSVMSQTRHKLTEQEIADRVKRNIKKQSESHRSKGHRNAKQQNKTRNQHAIAQAM